MPHIFKQTQVGIAWLKINTNFMGGGRPSFEPQIRLLVNKPTSPPQKFSVPTCFIPKTNLALTNALTISQTNISNLLTKKFTNFLQRKVAFQAPNRVHGWINIGSGLEVLSADACGRFHAFRSNAMGILCGI